MKPPPKISAIGRVYRPDAHDATHYSMFHQVEGLYIDRAFSMVDLKTTLVQFAKTFFGAEAEIRLRPKFFPLHRAIGGVGHEEARDDKRGA